MAYESTLHKPGTGQGTIANGASLTAAIDLAGSTLEGIGMPSAWTAAALSFQVSLDGGSTWLNLYNTDGTEYTVQAGVSRYLALPPSVFHGVQWLKIRSGTSGAAVNQAATRTLTLVTRAL